MKRPLALTLLILIASSALASDPSPASSMEQQGPKGVEKWRVGGRKLKPGTNAKEVGQILGFDPVLYCVLRQGVADVLQLDKNGGVRMNFDIGMNFDVDGYGWRLTSATVWQANKVIAQLETQP